MPLDGWRTSDEFISLLFWLCLIILIILIKYLVTRLDKANRCIYCYQNSNNAFEKTKKTIKNENGRCNELIITAESSKVCWILKDSLGILNFFLQFTHDSRNVHFINLKNVDVTQYRPNRYSSTLQRLTNRYEWINHLINNETHDLITGTE